MTLSTLSGRVRDHGRQLASQNSAFQLYQGRCPMISSSVGGIMVTATDHIKNTQIWWKIDSQERSKACMQTGPSPTTAWELRELSLSNAFTICVKQLPWLSQE